MTKLFASSEILGSMLATRKGAELKSEGKAFFTHDFHMNLADQVVINVVENTDAYVNLALPYYNAVSSIHLASPVDLERVSGGTDLRLDIMVDLNFGDSGDYKLNNTSMRAIGSSITEATKFLNDESSGFGGCGYSASGFAKGEQ